MTDLDSRQRAILEKMGIDVWQKRNRKELKEGSIGDSGTGLSESVADIASEISRCELCSLSRTRIKTVPGVGSESADWVFVGEAPGQNEDEQGQPFVGRAGQLLDAMIAALGMNRDAVFIANVIKCRPPGNRDPLPEEIQQCEPYLHRLLDILQPKVIVALGRISAQSLLKTGDTLGRIRGRTYEYGNRNTPMVVTYHPAYLLRSPQQKAAAWKDLLMARSIVLGSSGPADSS